MHKKTPKLPMGVKKVNKYNYQISSLVRKL